MPTRPVHVLNQPYKGSRRFEMKAPDAEGIIAVHARTEQEARDHLLNAFFELVFRGAHRTFQNPACPFCSGRTQRKGRNSAGTRVWTCQNPECRRCFVLNRVWRGGINHPSQSKKPEFVRLFLAGVSVADAADRLHLNHSTAGNWADQVAANNPDALANLNCPCGKPIRHRGSCAHRMAKHLRGKALQEAQQKKRTAAA